MNITISADNTFASVHVELQPGETFQSESSAMYFATSNVNIDVSTYSKSGKQGKSGGIMKGVKRLFAGESFFLSKYSILDDQPGMLGIAPEYQGAIEKIELDGQTEWYCTGGSFLAATSDVALDTRFQGIKGFFTGESISFLKLGGHGTVLIEAYGQIERHEVQDEFIVDTGHVVAYSEGLEYSATKVAGGWFKSWLAGEGIVLRFRGTGYVYTQSHNYVGFLRTLGPMLPSR